MPGERMQTPKRTYSVIPLMESSRKGRSKLAAERGEAVVWVWDWGRGQGLSEEGLKGTFWGDGMFSILFVAVFPRLDRLVRSWGRYTLEMSALCMRITPQRSQLKDSYHFTKN